MRLNSSIIIISIFVIILCSSASASINISSCDDFETPNILYLLNTSVSSGTTCFAVNADNVTLNCQGNSIHYSVSSSDAPGISIEGANYTSILNCIFIKNVSSTTLSPAIFSFNAYFISIHNNSFNITGDDSPAISLTTNTNIADKINHISNNSITTYGSSSYGVYLDSFSNNIIRNNLINSYGDTSHGVYLSLSSESNISFNSISTFGNDSNGLYLSSVSGIIFINNSLSAYGNADNAIYLEDTRSSNIINNSLSTRTNSAYGIRLDSSYNNSLAFNNISILFPRGRAISLSFDSNQNNISDNYLLTLNSSSSGISLVFNSMYNSVNNNTLSIFGANSSGISIESDSNMNYISNNSINSYGNYSYGLSVSSSFNNISNNIISTLGNFSSAVRLFSVDGLVNYIFSGTISSSGRYSDSIFVNSTYSSIFVTGLIILASGSMSDSIKVCSAQSNISIFDSYINTSLSSDILFCNQAVGGLVNFTNVSFSSRNFSINSTAELIASGYLTVKTRHHNTTFAPDTNITIKDRFQTIQYQFYTNQSGDSNKLILPQFVQNSSSLTYFSPYNITAVLASEQKSYVLNVSLDQNITFVFNVPTSSSPSSSSGSGGGGGQAGGFLPPSNKTSSNNSSTKNETPSKKNLFDVNLNIPKKIIRTQEGKVALVIQLINIGSIGKINVTITYKIYNSATSQLLSEYSQVIQVQTQQEFIKEIDVSDLQEGDYAVHISLSYPDQTQPAEASSEFSIVKGNKYNYEYIALRVLYFIFSFIFIIFIFLLTKNRRAKSIVNNSSKKIIADFS